ncbi:AvaB protein [Xylona heveae TC161]|uniref:AvaB protein n=1 Tax=Xylona heveae (strain CBS 132557 / TC161) TaxID=1328760 RepID=A0A165A2X7_XYLHT|nr:AvaB protein [Xylona heveae TC161]KZF19880.1 AvaB protein [Xylona heveae TC161]
MLSAFTARPIVELKQRDKSRIESILAYGNRLLVGLHTGSLRIYRINELADEAAGQDSSGVAEEGEPQPKQRAVDLLREEEKFSRRPVQQLAIIKEANILVALTDNYVSTYDLQTYALQEQLTRTKGATTFAVTSDIVKDPSTDIPSIVSRLVVAVKRKIIMWSWHDSELSSDVIEMALAASPKTLTWATGTKMIAGMDPGYVLIDFETQETTDIMGKGNVGGAAGQPARFGSAGVTGISYMGMASWVPKPLATRLGGGDLLLAKDINTLFIDSDGKAKDKRQIPWPSAPETIAYSYPYLLALQAPSKGSLEVRNPDTLSLLQSISLPGAVHLHVPQPYVSLAHAGKGFLVASERCIWRMAALDYDSQIGDLVEQEKLDEAISLIGMLEDALLKDKEGRLREIKMQKARVLFNLRKYRSSLDLFTDVVAPPERVISLYPRAIAGELSIHDDGSEGGTASEQEEETTQESKTEEGEESKAAIDTNDHPSRTVAGKVINSLKKEDSDAASIRSTRRGFFGTTSDTASIRGKHTENVPIEKPLEGRDLQEAVNELFTFLAQSRVHLQKYLNPDGTLRQPREPTENGAGADAGAHSTPYDYLLVPSTPSEDDTHREHRLRETAKLVDTTLFRAYMLARPSLAGSLFRIANFCDPDVVNEKLLEKGRYTDLVDFFHGKKLYRKALELLRRFGQADEADEAAPTLHGPQRTVGYLQNLPPEMIDLILEFSEWPIRADSDLGMEIFLADTENAETLPRDRVVDFLQGLDTKLAVRYLEHIIHELNDLTPEFHQRLVQLYLERLKMPENGDEKDFPFKDDTEKASWVERTLNFLKSSDHYSTARALGLLPRNEPQFYEARAIVLSKMGQHKQALEIYVFKLEDHNKAEEYCNHVHLHGDQVTSGGRTRRVSVSESDDSQPPSIYHTLLSLYLSPPHPYKPDWAPALELLSKHGSRLPASSTLDLIPSTLPIKELESYFRGRIRAANSVVNEGRIVAGLRKTEVVGCQAALLLGDGLLSTTGGGGRNRRVLIGEERVCGVCHKRLGASVISVLPDNQVYHLGCANRMRGSSGTHNIGSLRKAQWGE